MLLLLAYLGFISLGLPDAMLGVAWPGIRTTFALPNGALGAILLASSAGYLLSSFQAGTLLVRWGVGSLLAGSTLCMGLSLLGYALTPTWPGFLLSALLAGLGSGAIDAGLNGYAAHHFSQRHMNWLHACYGLGAMGGPLLLAALLTAGQPWRGGYVLVAGVMALLSVAFFATRGRWQGAAAGRAPERGGMMGAALRQPLVWLQMLLFFLYTGLEVTAGQWSFSWLTSARGVGVGLAGSWVGLYWGSLALGRVLFGSVIEQAGIGRVMQWSMGGILLASLLLLFSAWGLPLLGFFLAPIFPCLMAQTPARVGAGHAAHAVGFQVSAAMVGAVGLPGLAGLMVQGYGLESLGPLLLALALALALAHERLRRLAPLG